MFLSSAQRRTLRKILLLVLLVLLPAVAAARGPLRVVMDDNYPPYVFRGANGVLQGILVDEWRLWQEKTGVPVNLEAMEWGEAQRRMDAGEYDVIDTLFHTPERAKKYDFSPPHARIEVPIFFRKEIEGISGVASLHGFPVAAKRGGATTQMLRDAGIAPLMEYPSYESIVEAAAAGKISVFVVDRPPALFFLHKYGIADQFRQTEPFTVGEFHRAVLKGDSRTLELVNRGFALISDEEHAGISTHWLGTSLDDNRWGRQLMLGLAVVAGVCGLLALWNLTLRSRVRRKTRELAASEARFRALFEAIPEQVFRIDDKGRFLDCHAAVPEQLLAPPETFIGRTLAETLPAKIAELTMEELTMVLNERRARPFDYELTLPNGEQRWFSALMSPCGEGEALITVRDITERKEVEVALRSARDAAEAASRAKSEFLATMSHEIRTPLNGISGMTQLLRLTALTARQREYLGVLETSAGNLLTLINDILDLARIEAGKMILEEQDFAPRSCIEEVVAAQRPAIQQKALALHLAVDADCPALLRGDPLRLKQILFNLLGNAVKFTERGVIKVSARVEARREGQVTLRFSIADTGIGMSEEVQSRLFAPFEQGDAALTRKYGGSGLGLSICQRLVQMMCGRIEVESVPGCGSTFHVLLPFAVSVAPQVRPEATPPAATAEAAEVPPVPVRSLRVLIAEDNDINRRLLEILLRQLGHESVGVKHGQEALQRWREERFDVVLMDIQMPVMDGIEALRQLRREEMERLGRRQPVVALTAHAMAGDREKLLADGFDDYLSKPFSLKNLTAVLEQAERSETLVASGAQSS